MTIESVAGRCIRDFFENLCFWVSTHFAQTIEVGRDLDWQVLAGYQGHSMNFTPNRFRRYWQSQDPLSELRARVTKPGFRLLHAKRLSRAEMHRALSYTSGNESAQEVLADCIEEHMPVLAFQAWVKEKLIEERHSQFDDNLQEVLTEFDYASLKTHLPLLLHDLAVDLNFQEYTELLHYMDNSKKSQYLLEPFTAARLMHKALIKCSRSIYIPPGALEQAIRHCYGLPEVVELGNFNWIKKISEQLNYSYLILTWDILRSKLVLKKRWAGTDKALIRKTAYAICTTARVFH